MKANLLFVLFSLLLLNTNVLAQTNELNAKELGEIKESVKKRFDQLNGYILYIASKRRYKNAADQVEDSINKDMVITEVCTFFIGNGCQSVGSDGNIIPAPIINYSIKKKNGSVMYLEDSVPNFLRKMKYNKYIEVSTQDNLAFSFSKIRQLGPDEYIVTLSNSQNFDIEKKNDKPYIDKTDETCDIYVKRYIIDGKTKWNVLLSTVKVELTE